MVLAQWTMGWQAPRWIPPWKAPRLIPPWQALQWTCQWQARQRQPALTLHRLAATTRLLRCKFCFLMTVDVSFPIGLSLPYL